MTRIISICNHKGGVGKTTSTLNIGAGLQKMKKRVLLIDMDPQANLSQSVGLEDQECSIYGVLKGEYALKPVSIKKDLDIVPSVSGLSEAEHDLSSKPEREKILGKRLAAIKHNYNFVIIDCPPSLGLLTINALSSSHEVIIPLQVQYLAIHGLNKLLYIIDKVKASLNSELKMGGIILTQYNKRKILNKDVESVVKNQFKSKVFNTTIRDNVALAEAPVARKDIFEYNHKSNGAKDYHDLTREIAMKYQLVS